MIDTDAALGHHFLQIAKAQAIGQIPTNAKQNDGLVEMAALEHLNSPAKHQRPCHAPGYRKLCNTAFVKRHKHDAADAEAICEAAQRPTMRFVAVKSEEQQASAVVFRARDLLVRQRTQAIKALRGHLAEYGLVAAHGPSHVAKLIDQVEDPDSGLPSAARLVLGTLVETLRSPEERIACLNVEIARRAREDEDARRLATIPGIGPVTATALVALAPSAATFKRSRDFAAWPD